MRSLTAPQAAVIGTVGSFGGELIGGRANRRNARKIAEMNNAAAKAENELAYQREQEMWNQQNAYNSPEAQMSRYKDAGLNPHLIYGQGTPGNATNMPQYHPADIKYDMLQPPNTGAAIGHVGQSLLPMLMSVGSWIQDIKLKEAQTDQVKAATTKTFTQEEQMRQLIEHLRKRNPMALQDLNQKLSLFPYQTQMMQQASDKGRIQLADLDDELFFKSGRRIFDNPQGQGGMRALKTLEQISRNKLLDAQASWTDLDITNPQAIMQMVIGGVMGLAGKGLQLRFNQKAKNAPVSRHLRENPRNWPQMNH